MIPETKIAGVKHAMQVTFGVTEFDAITELTAGLSSALVFRIVIQTKAYLLRIITRTDAVSDPTYQYARMKTAVEAGIAPQVWYTNIEDRISITDFIETKPFSINEAKIKLPDLIKRLHSLPLFPHRLNYFEAIDNFIQKFKVSKILPEHIITALFHQYDRIKNIYPFNNSDLVSCHNDLKPENILFDGKRLWLIDWEAAFLNDRYVDLAIVANFVVTNKNEEKAFLKKYFGEEVNEYHYASFFLVCQIVHLSYTAYLFLCTSVPIDPNLIKPDFRGFHNDMWAGKITLADKNAWQPYAWVHLEQLQKNLDSKRFEDSLRIILSKQISQDKYL